jgi:tetratricopeptide (TPR) repeat protein
MNLQLLKNTFGLLCVFILLALGYIFFISSGPPTIRPQEGSVTDPILLPAITKFADAVDSNPNQPKPRMELGMTYEGAGLNELAEQTYLQYTKQFPNRVIGWYRLAIVQERQGKINEAIQSLERASEVAGEKMVSPHWQLAFWYIEVGNLTAAKKQVAKAEAKNAYSIQVKLAKGRIALGEGDYDLAIEILNDNTLIANVPNGYVYQLLGRAYRATGNEEKSRESWSRAGQTNPKWADPWTEIVVQHVVGLNAKRQEIMKLFRANEIHKMRMLLTEYFVYEKDNRVVRRLDASCNVKEGKVSQALKKYVQLIEEEPTDIVTMVLLAKLRMQLSTMKTKEEIEITREILQTVLEISPDHPQAKILLESLSKE